MTKTVGTVPAFCAATKSIIVNPGTTVTYCYAVQNIGNLTLTLHDLVDSELDQLLNDEPITLLPGQSTFRTFDAVINVTTVNSATWTAFNDIQPLVARGVANQTSDQDTAQVIVNTPTPTNTATATNTPTPTNTATNTPTPTNTATSTPSSTATNTATNTPTSTATSTPTSTPTNTVTNTPTNTATPTIVVGGGTPTLFEGPPAIPTLSGIGAAVLALLLGAIAALYLRRR